jgi:hypothetical protein
LKGTQFSRRIRSFLCIYNTMGVKPRDFKSPSRLSKHTVPTLDQLQDNNMMEVANVAHVGTVLNLQEMRRHNTTPEGTTTGKQGRNNIDDDDDEAIIVRQTKHLRAQYERRATSIKKCKINV